MTPAPPAATATASPPQRADASLPVGDEKRAMVRSMFDAIAPRYDLVNRLQTFGLDMAWRRRAVRLLGLAPGSRVVDLASGTGDLLEILAAGGWRGVGVDISAGMLTVARRRGAGRWALLQGEGGRLPLADASVDGVISGFALRNFDDLAGTLGELARVVRPNGRISLLDVDEPTNPVLKAGHRFYFRHVVPRLGALLSDAKAYSYLPRSVAYLPAKADLLRMIGDAGFTDVRHVPLSGGVTQVLTGTRKASGS